MRFARISRLLAGLLLVTFAISVACGPAVSDGREPDVFETLDETTDFLAADVPDDSTEPTVTQQVGLDPASSETDVSNRIEGISSDASLVDANGIQVGFTAEGRPYRGSLDAPVVIEEFSDYQCPYCSRFFSQTLPALIENQIAAGEVRMIFYDYPLTSIHPQATAAANAARCAGEQGALAFWDMHDLIFTDPDQWGNRNAVQVFDGFAEKLNLDMERFRTCQNNQRYYAEIEGDLSAGRERGVSSTPSFFINGQPLIGAQPLSVFNQAISVVQSGERIASAQESPPEPQRPTAKPTPASVLLDDVAGRIGAEDAPVTIVEYTDYQCPYCQRHNAQTLPALLNNLIESGRARYLVKDFPLDSIHPEARTAAVAARCAGEQGAYWEMHDAIFSAQSEWSGQGDGAVQILSSLATDLSLDEDAFDACINSGRYDDVIQANQDEGLALGVRGTPFFFIDGYPINGAQPFELFEYAIGLAEQGTLADAYVPPPEQEAQEPPPQPEGPVDVPVAGAFSIGAADAPVTIVEYTDFQCPYCSRHFVQTMPLLEDNFIDKGLVRYVFKDFPLTSIHPQAVDAAEAARCAGEQGAYVEMHDILFQEQERWSGRSDAADVFAGFADQLSLEAEEFRECLASKRHEAPVLADLEEGVGFGVRGTPAFFINGTLISGAQPYSVFEEAINAILSQ